MVTFGRDVRFRDYCNIHIADDATLNIEDHVHFNRYCSINCLGKINVGRYTIFGEGVKLYDHNHIYKDMKVPIQSMPCNVGSITIGSNCWIGANVTILNNVVIGDNVVIGANNLIYKDVQSNVIVKHKADYILESKDNCSIVI